MNLISVFISHKPFHNVLEVLVGLFVSEYKLL